MDKRVLRVLVVDDSNRDQEQITRAILRAVPGAEVIAAIGELEMNAELAKGEFHLITMDGFLENDRDEYGPYVVRNLRARGIATPILMISMDRGAMREGIKNGANGMLDKIAVERGADLDNPDVLLPELMRLGLV